MDMKRNYYEDVRLFSSGVVGFWMSILVLAARNIVKTKVGRAFISIRDADIAAETMGVNLT